MKHQLPAVYGYKNWLGRWKFKFMSSGLPRADKLIALLYEKPPDYDTLAIACDAWQKVARATMEENKELVCRVTALQAELVYTKQELEKFYDE